MKRTLIAALLVVASFGGVANAETNNGARSGGTPQPTPHVTDFSECGDLHHPIRLYGPNSTMGDKGSYLRVKTDRGWCDHSGVGIDNAFWDADGPFVSAPEGGEGEGEGEGEGGEGGGSPK